MNSDKLPRGSALSHLDNFIFTILPFAMLGLLLVSITGVLVYSLGVHQPVPDQAAIGVSVTFAIFLCVFATGYLVLYFLKPFVLANRLRKHRTSEGLESASATALARIENAPAPNAVADQGGSRASRDGQPNLHGPPQPANPDPALPIELPGQDQAQAHGPDALPPFQEPPAGRTTRGPRPAAPMARRPCYQNHHDRPHYYHRDSIPPPGSRLAAPWAEPYFPPPTRPAPPLLRDTHAYHEPYTQPLRLPPVQRIPHLQPPPARRRRDAIPPDTARNPPPPPAELRPASAPPAQPVANGVLPEPARQVHMVLVDSPTAAQCRNAGAALAAAETYGKPRDDEPRAGVLEDDTEVLLWRLRRWDGWGAAKACPNDGRRERGVSPCSSGEERSVEGRDVSSIDGTVGTAITSPDETL